MRFHDRSAPEAALDIKGTSTTILKVQGDSSGYVNAALLLQSNDHNHNYRGGGVFMYDSAANNEWFAGRPYASADRYTITRLESCPNNAHTTEVAQTTHALFTILSGGAVEVPNGSISAQGFNTVSGRRLEAEIEENTSVINEHKAAINELQDERRRRLEATDKQTIADLRSEVDALKTALEKLQASIAKLNI